MIKELLEAELSCYSCTPLSENKFIVYTPNYFCRTTKNLPLVITLLDEKCLLSDQGTLADELEENEGIELSTKKEEITKICDKYVVKFENNCFTASCKPNEIVYKISDFMQVLILVTNL